MIVLSLPWIILVLLLLVAFLLIKKKWVAGVILFGIGIIVNWWSECVPFRVWPINESCSSCLKVMTFNINGGSEDIGSRVEGIAEIIKITDPDIVFLAEYGKKNTKRLDSLLKEVFPYTTLGSYGAHYFCSKYPIERQHLFIGHDDEYSGAYMTRMSIGKDTINVYGCHFASNNYAYDRSYMTPDSIKDRNDVLSYIRNVQRAYERRCDEADILAERMKSYYGPSLVLGDFNDIGGSRCVRKLELEGLQDTWWEGGFGYGATIYRPLPYRIDHIMHTRDLKLKKIKVINSKGLSDHNALYAEFDY